MEIHSCSPSAVPPLAFRREIQRRHFDLVSPSDLACSPPLISSVGCAGGDEAPLSNHGDLRAARPGEHILQLHVHLSGTLRVKLLCFFSSSLSSVKDSEIHFTDVFLFCKTAACTMQHFHCGSATACVHPHNERLQKRETSALVTTICAMPLATTGCSNTLLFNPALSDVTVGAST